MAKKELSKQDILKDTLFKKAMGYTQDEIVEEYVPEEDGTFRLSKKKVTKKNISPDITAAKVLLEYFLSKEKQELSELSDDELESEKLRLLNLLAKSEHKENLCQEDDDD